MYYLIDGYNLLFALVDSKKSLQSQRQSIIRSLQEEFEALELEGTVVFDGVQPRGGESGLAYKSPLVIAYSFSGETADHYILDKVEVSKRPSELTVVSNDKHLTGAHTKTIKEFLALLKKKQSKKPDKVESFTESQQELERLIKIFEARLRDSE